MPELYERDCLTAWQEGARLIRANHKEVFNLMTHIEVPFRFNQAWLNTYSPHGVIPGSDRIKDVISTIFPHRLISLNTLNRNILYARYLRVHRRAKHWPRNRSRWGTYFERLIDFGAAHKNQLETVINKLQTWPRRNTTSLVFHLSSAETDNLRTRGGPCWHYGEILWKKNNVLDLVAVYRNHDYFGKTLGNFIALGQLLNFIALQSGKTPGNLICHSIHAYSEKPIRSLSQLAQI